MENNKSDFWGLLAVINLYDVDQKIIKNVEAIEIFTKDLCKFIDMKRHGHAMIERFGKGDLEGYSMMQFIETSSIIAHFDEIKNRAFIDIFSCKIFDPYKALNFCIKFFNAKSSQIKVINRD